MVAVAAGAKSLVPVVGPLLSLLEEHMGLIGY